MRITRIDLRNVKSFYDKVSYTLDPDVNIIVGPNAGGKSNLLECIQGLFNSVIFRPANIVKDDSDMFAWRLNIDSYYTDDNSSFMENIFDYNTSSKDKNQHISVTCVIEYDDVLNIESLKKNIEKIEKFELEQTGNTILTRELRQAIEVMGPINNLIGASFNILVENHRLIKPSNQGTVRVDGFFDYLTLTNALTIFLNNLYNYENDEKIDFRACFTYLSASRVPISLGNMNTNVQLTNINDLSQISFLQLGHSAENVVSHFDALRHRLALNVHSGRSALNKPFESLLSQINLQLEIHQVRSIDNQYKINFIRDDGSSPKLSAGEKELMNLLSLFFVQDLKGGVVLIDEPEMHLHPRWQKKLLGIIKTLNKQCKTQFILVTHSAHLIEPSTVKNVARVYKDADRHSHIVKPNTESLNTQAEKDVFQVVNALNTEKIYFADKVVMVEGIEDRIIVEKALSILQGHPITRTIEVIAVGGKNQFEKFRRHLGLFLIDYAIIADLDYASDIGSTEITDIFKTSSAKAAKRMKGKTSLDNRSLGNELDKLFSSSKKAYTEQDLKSLRELWHYILNRSRELSDDINEDQKRSLTNFISKMEKSNIYILPSGDIESVFGSSSHFDTERAIQEAKNIKKANDIPSPLKRILMHIVK